ncbi:MAG: hypothetical protein OHK93_006891 [Ramalina farinacea]|uniref:Amino acid permease/ SLC12A domain-containing protein n=1 Tax=Ramalina farinacea TaxID=258253 RepID=A0AA43TQI3_9LECA|nr:hypothetical protein [Ramalina farinacea]
MRLRSQKDPMDGALAGDTTSDSSRDNGGSLPHHQQHAYTADEKALGAGADTIEASYIPTDPQYGSTTRALKSRHIQLIALGGCIGTGLFVGTGATLSLVGPAALFLSFLVISALVWVVMQDLAELATYIPLSGSSVPFYVHRYVEPSLAFAAGWNYWYAYAMLVAAEVSAANIVIGYWSNPVPEAVWITIILATIVVLNIFVVSWYGESEFWFASIKILGILGLIVVGVVLFFGGGPKHDRLGFRYWKDPPGAFQPYEAPGDTGKFLAFWTALVRSGFAFILSPELIVLAAGETEAPRRNIPKASKRFIYRLLCFYILGTLVISIIVSCKDDDLLQAVNSGTSNAGASPFVVGIQRAGIQGLNHVVNAVILTSAWSAGNSFLFAGSRSLYSLAKTGQAPKIFMTCNRHGVPYYCVAVTALLACLVYLNVSSGSAQVFTWFVNLTTISGYIAWIVLMITYLRFRHALSHNGLLHTRPYRSPGQPYASYATLTILIIVTLTNGFQVFFPGNFSAGSFLAAYITLPIFVVLYLGHKIWFRTPLFYRVRDIDVWSGKAEADRLEEEDVPPVAKNWVEKVWFWIA